MLTYNRETLVSRAIESILAQTFRDFEFIIVDNGSTDKSGTIAEEYAARDSRVRVIHRESGSVGAGRNTGLDVAKGEYITFIDDDDWCKSDFLEFLLDLAIENNADTACCGSWKEVAGLLSPNHIYLFDEKYIFNGEDATEIFLKRKLYNAAPPTKLVRKNLFAQFRFNEFGQFEDIGATYKFFVHAKRVAVHGIPKYTFVRHNNNNSQTAINHKLINNGQLLEYVRAFSERTAYITALYPQLFDLCRYSEWSYMISMVEKINRNSLFDECSVALTTMLNTLDANRTEFLTSEFIQDFEKHWMGEYVK
jgi:glycosyltransferase involved in cell wall biosynthesis